ncbi:MAG: protein-disulfide reductase DsbD domain-containing protein [Alphaproteobacteria bacterium]
MISRRILLASPLVFASSPAFAGYAASAWSRDTKSGVRLIAGPISAKANILNAGIHVALDGNTKTYWRTPGDSGVPPTFDWSASDNVSAVTVRWPAPRRFSDGSGFSIGYKADVVFPLEVSPKDPNRPVLLALAMDYAVCDTMCIPAKGAARLALLPGASPPPVIATLFQNHATRVPTLNARGFGLELTAVDRSGPHPRITLVATVPAETGVDLFAEGPDPTWNLPLPDALDQAGPMRRFSLVLEGAPRGIDPLEHRITYTLTAGDHAFESALASR